MAGILLILFLAIVVVDVWAAVSVIFRPRLGERFITSYWLVVILVIVTTIVMTGYFSYYSNPNTQVFGWPIARVIFQRKTPDSPWLDYFGPTAVLAYPINFILSMFIPSVIFVLLSRRRGHATRNDV